MLNTLLRRGILRTIDDAGIGVASDQIEEIAAPAEETAEDSPTLSDEDFAEIALARGYSRPEPVVESQPQHPSPWDEATQRIVARHGWADPNAIAYEANAIQNQRLQSEMEMRLARFEDAQMQPRLEEAFEQRGWPREAARSFSAARRAVGALSGHPEEQSLLASALSIGLHMIKTGAESGRRPQNPEADLGAPATGAMGLGLKGAEASHFENWRKTWYGDKPATRAMVKEFRSL